MAKPGEIELGDLVKDQISGFQGVAVAKTLWINGCVRWTLQPEKQTKEGAPGANETFDEQQMVVVKKAKIAAVPAPTAARPTTGGPRPAPKRSADPTKRHR